MKEIGGFIELDQYCNKMMHENAIALNCGRNALAYLLRSRSIKKIWIPKYICNSITKVCEREGVPYQFYRIGIDFYPIEEITPGEGEWVYYVNYFSQISNSYYEKIVEKNKRIIIDNAQSYFQTPIVGIDTIYTCRKYFGVPDGAFLYTNSRIKESLPVDESFLRMNYLLGRFERSASEFYSEYKENNNLFYNEPVKKMSKLTLNLLRGIDYQKIEKKRIENFDYLNQKLESINRLKLHCGSFMYPLFISNGRELRNQLINHKIYVPVLWPDVFGWSNEDDIEYQFAENIIPLPIDQRYDFEDMQYIVEMIFACLKNKR